MTKIETIKQLFALAESTPYPEEAKSAKTKAEMLMKKYGITKKDLKQTEDVFFDEKDAERVNKETEIKDPYRKDRMSKFNIILDFRLKKAINEELKRDQNENISVVDIQKLRKLYASNRGICSIEGLQYAKNLSKLDLSDNYICDIKPISILSNLRSLKLSNNRVSNISPLLTCFMLQYLSLAKNPVGDLSPLRTLRHLHTLDIKFCQYIKNAEVLSLLPRLKKIIYPNEKKNLFTLVFPLDKNGKRHFNREFFLYIEEWGL